MTNDQLTDPLAATKPEFSRRSFVALGSGAALTIGNAAAAAAQTDGFGKPHPPIVAEYARFAHAKGDKPTGPRSWGCPV